MYQNVRNNIVGGPSIVFSRSEKTNETVINDEKVKSIVGYDANALYFSAIGGNMPTGPLTHYVCNSDNALVSEKCKFFKPNDSMLLLSPKIITTKTQVVQ